MPLTRAQAREFDRRAADEFGMPSLLLMENAGRGAAVQMRKYNPTKRRVVVVCGKGNNGGDGFVIARHLDNFGWPVKVLLFAKPSELAGDAAVMFDVIKRSRLSMEYVPADAVRFEDYLNDELTNYGDGWIVDALFGTGLSGDVHEPFDRVIAAMNASPAPVLAVDIPSGLDCDTGRPLGIAVRADVTATFVDRKAGFLAESAQPWLGEVHVVEIGAPRALVEQYRAV
ncbi:MAG: NAD(P)H-hydrate epimerase [Gemmataceae bacterium]